MVWGPYTPAATPEDVAPARSGRPAMTLASVLDELCDGVFATLARHDQRLRARQYLHGLLQTSGRRTIRNIAASIGGAGIDQRLHHFISDSTWRWEPVRTALTRYVTGATAPAAWVIRPVTIPKAGRHTVGAGRRFCPARRRIVRAQQAVGVVAVSDRGSFPVNWRLRLPREWLEDDRRRARSALPGGLRAETLAECAAQVCRRVLGETGIGDLPVVLDGRHLDGSPLRMLRAATVATLVRIPPGTPLYVSDPGLAGHRADVPLAARQIAEAAKSRRGLVTHVESGVAHPYLVSAVDVRTSADPAGRQRPLRLTALGRLGEYRPGEDSGEELWLSTPTRLPVTSVLGLTKRLPQVDRDLGQIADRVGIWDFSGRSFPGWHRHVTLASAAHLAQVLAGSGQPPDGLRRWLDDAAPELHHS